MSDPVETDLQAINRRSMVILTYLLTFFKLLAYRKAKSVPKVHVKSVKILHQFPHKSFNSHVYWGVPKPPSRGRSKHQIHHESTVNPLIKTIIHK